MFRNISINAEAARFYRAASNQKGLTMSSIDIIRLKIKKLYEVCPDIHINVSMKNPKITRKNVSATITGVYPHVFQVRDKSGDGKKSYTLQYSDVLIKQIEIAEFDRFVPKN